MTDIRKIFCIGWCVTAIAFVANSLHAADAPQARLDEKFRPLLREHCVKCHSAEKPSGEVRLDDISFAIDSVKLADLWQKVLNQMNSGGMPPEDSKQLDRDSKTDFLEALSTTLVVARRSLSDVQGKITMRRLNRREYKNTIRNLLGVEIGVKELPADGGAGAFDTVGSSLFMSSDQFEQYLALGRTAIDESFARYAKPHNVRKLRIECEERNARIEKALEKRKDDRARYEKWTVAVDQAASKPENADVAAMIRDEKKGNATHLYSQWQRLKGAPSPKEFGFVDAVNADEMGRRDWVHYVPHHRAYLEQPGVKTGSYLTVDDVFVNPYQPFRIPGDWPPGDYVVRVRIAASDNAPAERRFVEFGSQHDSGVRAVTSSHHVTGTMAQPQIIEIPLKFSPNKGHGFFFQEKGTYESDGAANRLFAEAKRRNGIGPEFSLWLDWIEVEGRDVRQSAVGAATGSEATRLPSASGTNKLRKDPEQWANKYMPIYAEGFVKKYERFQNWCAAIDKAAERPENADLVKKLRDEPKIKQSPHLFYNRYAEIKGAPPPTDFEFRDVDDAQFARSEYSYHFRYYSDYQKLPQRETGSWLMLYSLGRYTGIAAPEKWPAGKYTLRVRLAASDESPKERRFIEIGTGKTDASDFNVVSSHQVTGSLAEPQTLEIPVTINASGDRNFAIRDKRPNNREAEYSMFREAWDKTGTGPRPCIWIDYVELEGPVSGIGFQPVTTSTRPAITKAGQVANWNTDRRNAYPTIKQRREVELHANRMVGGTYNGYFKGGYEVAKAYLDSDRTKPPSAFGKGIADEVEAKFRVKVFQEHGPSFERYLKDPLTQTGAYLTIFNVHPEEVITLPPDQPSGWLKTKHEVEKAEPGEYMLRFRVGAVKGTPKDRHFVAFGSRKDKDDFQLLKTFQISGTIDEPQTIEVPISITADGPRTFVLREKRDVKLDHEIYTAARKETGVGPVSALWIDWVEWEGPLAKPSPLETEAVQPVLFANTRGVSDREHALAILERFAVRAFRDNAPKPEYLQKLLKLFDARIQAGDPFDVAIREPLSVVLASPRFLYLSEPAEDGRRHRLSNLELATRLSYFLWSAPPDAALLGLARSGELQKPEVLAAEVERMLSSEKSREFVQGFVPQWLGMERLDFFQFNTQLYRDFDESMKATARREVYENFEYLIRENGSIRNLLKSDYVIVNGLLANFYGLENVSGDEFRKVMLPADSPRGGLLGMSAILAMGSNGEVTSPVERGAWVLRKLLHDPPPPAPPAVPQLTRLEGKLLTTRERILAHQEEPQCANCHRKIDPIGFGLENFNAVGKWRTEDRYEKKGVGKKEWTIDPAGTLHKGPSFKNYFELRDIIAAKPERFARGLTEALIEYALGRPYGFADQDLADAAVRRAAEKDFALREIVQAIVGSNAFQMK